MVVAGLSILKEKFAPIMLIKIEMIIVVNGYLGDEKSAEYYNIIVEGINTLYKIQKVVIL